MSDPILQVMTHDEAVRDMVARIQVILQERLPSLGATTAASRRRLTSAASVSDEFLYEVIVALQQSPEAGVLNRITEDEVRDTIEFCAEYITLASQLETIARSVRTVVAEKRYDLGQRALGVYAVMKGVQRPNRKPALSNAAALRRTLGRGRPRKVTKAVSPGDAPKP